MDDHFERAKRWIKNRTAVPQQAYVSEKLFLGTGSRGRGVMLREPARKGEILLRLPIESFLTAEWWARDELPELEYEFGEFSFDWRMILALAAQLQEERALGEHSAWKEYIALIPEEFLGHPINWSDGSRQRLHFQHIGIVIESFEALIRDVAQSWDIIDVQGFTWAFCAVLSRSFDDGPGVMVPFLDSCNHSSEPSLSIQKLDGGYEVVAAHDMNAFEELTYDYNGGRRITNDELLLCYGFVEKDNSGDVVLLHNTPSLWRTAFSRAGAHDIDLRHLPGLDDKRQFRVWRDGVCSALWSAALSASAEISAEAQRTDVALQMVATVMAESLAFFPMPGSSSASDRCETNELVDAYLDAKMSILKAAIQAS